MRMFWMPGKAVWVAVLWLSFLPLLWGQRGNPEVQFEGQSVDQMIAGFMKEHRVPGMALAIVQAPYVTRVTGYGLSDPEKQLLVSARTLFPLGPLQDAFTAVGILQLVEAGKLSLEDPIGNYLGDLPPKLRTVSVRNILRHSSGVPDPSRPGAEYEPGTDIFRNAEHSHHLQRLIAKVSGTTYEIFVREGQIEKLGLRETLFSSALPKSEVSGPGGKHEAFLQQPSLIHPLEPALGSSSWESGSNPILWASAMDVSIWDIGLAGDILIRSPELRKILYAPAVLKNGKTLPTSGIWDFPGRPGLMLIKGSTPGYSVLLSRYTAPSDLLCVTLLANREGLDLAPLARRIAGAFDAKLANDGE